MEEIETFLKNLLGRVYIRVFFKGRLFVCDPLICDPLTCDPLICELLRGGNKEYNIKCVDDFYPK